tara:strand:+ start:1731 stop:2000 length:270 start_codon:yes stop_codon:yes gene_type:complete
MPIEKMKIFDRLVSQLKEKGVENPHAVATKRLQEAGVLKKGTRDLTEKGKRRQAMGASGRAKARAAKLSDHKPSDYTYDPKTNQATLKA